MTSCTSPIQPRDYLAVIEDPASCAPADFIEPAAGRRADEHGCALQGLFTAA